MTNLSRHPQTAIHVRTVSKSFGHMGTHALRDVSFTVDEGQFAVLLGPSGCGKTTLLRMLGGLIEANHGDVRVHGHAPVPGPKIGMVFQSFRLVPWMTVAQNVNFALGPLSLAKSERRDRVHQVLGRVGLARFHSAYPHMLSGGMMQRVALARALVCEPRVLLMDEPFAALDAHTRELMQNELRRLVDRQGITTVFVTHSVDEALILGNQIIILSPRPGRVVEHLPVKFRDRAAHDDPRDQIGFAETRKYLANRLKDLVLNDPGSDFYDPSRSHNTMSARHIVNMSDPDTKTGLHTTGDVVAFVKH